MGKKKKEKEKLESECVIQKAFGHIPYVREDLPTPEGQFEYESFKKQTNKTGTPNE